MEEGEHYESSVSRLSHLRRHMPVQRDRKPPAVPSGVPDIDALLDELVDALFDAHANVDGDVELCHVQETGAYEW